MSDYEILSICKCPILLLPRWSSRNQMSRFHFFVMLKSLLKERIHLWIELGSLAVHLVEEKLHRADLLSKAHKHIVSGLVAGVTHWNTIWMRSSLDVLSTRTEGDDMLHRHAIVPPERGVLHSYKAGGTCLPHTVGPDVLEPGPGT